MNQDNMIIIWDTVGMSIQYEWQYVNEDLAGDCCSDLCVVLVKPYYIYMTSKCTYYSKQLVFKSYSSFLVIISV